MNTKQLSFSFVISLIIFSNVLFSQNLPVIKLAESLNKTSEITVKDFIQSITYIPLETSPECIVDVNPKVFVTNDYILITTVRKCLVFDRKTGAFIRELGQYGRGPEEYRNTLGFLNESTSSYYFRGWNENLLKYSLDGKFRGSIKIPLSISDMSNPSAPELFSFLDDTTLVCNFVNISGVENKFLMIFGEKGNIIRVLPNKYIFKGKTQRFVSKEVSFHRFNNSLNFQDRYNDTVFKISREKIIPSFILSRGEYSPPPDSRWAPLEKIQYSKYILQPIIYFENTRFISFNFNFNRTSYFTLYDKTLKSVKTIKNVFGIRNNHDGFVDLTFKSINEAGELSCLIHPVELYKWIEQYPEKFKALSPELQKLKNINLEDNPIVVIANYKQ